MINFRYHLVSMVAVFLALAVGVVLGAGPLQNAISRAAESDTSPSLDPQTAQALAVAEGEAQAGQELATAIASDVLPGTIEGDRIAIVALPGSDAAELETVTSAFTEAGANVPEPVEITGEFVSQDSSTYRDTLASPVSGHLTTRPHDPSSASVLAQGLVDVLTAQGSEVELTRDLLTDEATPLILGSTLPSSPVDALVLVGPGAVATTSGEGEDEGAEASAPLTQEAWLALAQAFADSGLPAVAVGQAAADGDFITVLRQASSPLATVDRGGTPMGALNAALVIASAASGAFGTQMGAKTVLAPLP